MKNFISRITMKRTKKSGFTDIVSGDYVSFWIDCYGVEWMAVSRFGFRTKP